MLFRSDYILNVGGADKPGYDGKAFKVPSATAKVLAVINPSGKFKAACVASAPWSVINGAVEQTLDEVIGASKDNFMMINAGAIQNFRNCPQNEAELYRIISMEHRLQKGWRPKVKKRPDTPTR